MNDIIAQYKQWIKDAKTLDDLNRLEFRADRTWDNRIPTELKNLFAERRDQIGKEADNV